MDFPGFTAEAGLIPSTQSYRSRRTRQFLGNVDAQQFDDGDDSGIGVEDEEGIEGEDLAEENGEDLEAEDEGDEGEAA